MSTLLEKANELTALVSAIEGAMGVGHALAALAEVEQQIQGTKEKLERELALLSEPDLPKVGTIDIVRVETVVSGSDKVRGRLAQNPSTVNGGKTWAKLNASSKALVKDLEKLSSIRWLKLVDSVSTAELDAFFATLAPGPPGLDELKRHVATLEECRTLETPSPSDVAKARRAIDGIAQGKEDLKAYSVPEGIREKYVRLVQGTWPLAEFDGEIAKFVESQGISKKVIVGLDLEGDG